MLQSDHTSARNKCRSEEASLYLLSSLCIMAISLGNDDTSALNSTIICFLPENMTNTEYYDTPGKITGVRTIPKVITQEK